MEDGRDATVKTRVVVLGAGFAGTAFFESFNTSIRRRARDRVEMTVINNTNYQTFAPLLYQVATGQVNERHIAIPVCCDINEHGSRFMESEVLEVMPERNEVVTRSGPVYYDQLVIALGAENNTFGIDGVSENTIPLKSLKDGPMIRDRILDSFKAMVQKKDYGEDVSDLATYVVIGGGASGVELAASIGDYIRELDRDYRMETSKARVIILEAQDRLMKIFGEKFSQKLETYLADSGIEILLNAKVSRVTNDKVLLDDGTPIRSRNVFWTAGIRSNPVASMLGNSRVQKKGGRVMVDKFLRVPEFENVTVAGDNAFIVSGHNSTVPQTAAAALQEGHYLGRRIAAAINNKHYSHEFIYRDPGIMLSLGKYKGLCRFHNGMILTGVSAWFIWRFVHLFRISTFRNKVEILLDWFFTSFHRRDVISLH